MLRQRLGGSCLLDGLVRVDVMWDDNLNRLVVNEIESLEACFGATTKENDEVDSFLLDYWFNVFQLKLLPLIRLKTEHLRRVFHA